MPSRSTNDLLRQLRINTLYYRKVKNLRPPDHLKLAVKKNFGIERMRKQIRPNEVDLLRHHVALQPC